MGVHDHEYTEYANNAEDTLVRVGGSRVGASPSGRVWEPSPLERSRVGEGELAVVFLKGNGIGTGYAMKQGPVEVESNSA